MEEYNQVSENSNPRGNLWYTSALLAGNSSTSNHGRSETGGSNMSSRQTQLGINNFHGGYFQSDPIVKTEASTSLRNVQNFHHPLIRSHQSSIQSTDEGPHDIEVIRAKIIAHPQYSNLLEAHMDCQKIGAPPEVAARLADARREFEARHGSASKDCSNDPELDQFMEAYYNMLVKYREEITRPIQEAMDFISRIESQLTALCNGPVQIVSSDDRCEGIGSSDDDHDNSGGDPEIDPRAGDQELKNQLLRKYSGYLSSLKQELSKKKKKGKLPKEARQKLLSWWELHYKWPYPSEAEKMELAESTGLDQKQINNWFINQRKRHWKPSEDMQFMVMDGLHHPPNEALYMDSSHYMADGHYRLRP